ncbi:hypothetical protein [Streptomyces liliifuscus]|uniref:Uncharacterized protein n=1 Tax=Streptomyces liliifuscus TaxID=2797636 RepID=A0A7T7I721_9ACTN|nr:hypothetical protein [Streptomyces liliifuscus]QQM41982.1 hypothetical protein JEQ17_22745 [Streptomyces liliifuscus]
MTTTQDTDVHTIDEEDAPSLGALLLASAANPRHKAAVRALVDEEFLLSLERVRTALVVKTPEGRMGCDWERFGKRLYTLGLNESDRAFLDLVLSLAGPHQTSLARVLEIDDRRLAIVLRATVQLSGCDTLAIGTRT